jgi:hypothetical protein
MSAKCGSGRMKADIPFDKPGPRIRGICLIRLSEAMNASYLRASFLMSFLFLLSFFRSSALMASTPPCLALCANYELSGMSHNRRGIMISPVDVMLITEDADGHIWPRDDRKLDRARKTLVALRIVILEADLEPMPVLTNFIMSLDA